MHGKAFVHALEVLRAMLEEGEDEGYEKEEF